MFFDGYVRKTWLTDPDEITSDWANQRIKPIGWRLRKEQIRGSKTSSDIPGSDPANSGKPQLRHWRTSASSRPLSHVR